MKNTIKFAFASALALSSVVPALANHPSKMSQPAQHRQVERIRPASGTDAMAYVPNTAPVESPYDFGIGSQR
jgi:hypothetical protein